MHRSTYRWRNLLVFAIMNEVMETHTSTKVSRSAREWKQKNSIEHTCMWLAGWLTHTILNIVENWHESRQFLFYKLRTFNIFSSQIIKIIIIQPMHELKIWHRRFTFAHTHAPFSFVCLCVWIEIIEIRSQHSKWSFNGNIFGTKKSI